jgi:uncharacterized protein YjbJ (UPF0337 family)
MQRSHATRIDQLSRSGNPQKERRMDKDRIKGAADQAKGRIKSAAGKALGDQKLQVEGEADKAKGKLESAVGGLKHAVRDAEERSEKRSPR